MIQLFRAEVNVVVAGTKPVSLDDLRKHLRELVFLDLNNEDVGELTNGEVTSVSIPWDTLRPR